MELLKASDIIKASDIREHTFSKEIIGGFNKKDVNTFISKISDKWQEVDRGNEILREELKKKNEEIEFLRTQLQKQRNELIDTKKELSSTNEKLYDANSQVMYLQSQGETHSKIISDIGKIQAEALQNRKEIIESAEKKAKRLEWESQQKAKALVDKAKEKYNTIMKKMHEELETLKHNYNIIDNQTNLITSEFSKILSKSVTELNKISHLKELSFIEKRISKMNEQMSKIKKNK